MVPSISNLILLLLPLFSINIVLVSTSSISFSGYDDPLIFESSEMNFDDGDASLPRVLRRVISLNDRLKDVPNESNIEKSESIAFQPNQQSDSYSYNRRPLSTEAPTNAFQRFQSPSELWSKMDEIEADSQTDDKAEIKPGIQFESSSPSDLNPIPQDVIRSDQEDALQQEQQEESEDDLLNMFFSHVKTTTTTFKPLALLSPSKYYLEDKQGHDFISKKYRKHPKDKHGRKTKTKELNKNIIIDPDIMKDDNDDLAFLTFDSGIQRRKCSSGEVKDGKCKPQALIH